MTSPTRKQRRAGQNKRAGSPLRPNNENRTEPHFRPVSPEERSGVVLFGSRGLKHPLPLVYSTFDRGGREPELQRRGTTAHQSDPPANIRWRLRGTTGRSANTREETSTGPASPSAGSTQYRIPRAALAPWEDVVSAPARALSSSGSSTQGPETPHADEAGLYITTTVNGVAVRTYNPAEVWLTAVHPIVTIVNGEEITLPHTYSLEVTPVQPGKTRTGAPLGYLQRLQNLSTTQHQSTSSNDSDGVLLELQELVKKDGRAKISLATAASVQAQSSGSDVPVSVTSVSETETRPAELQSLEEGQEEEVRYQRMLSRFRFPFEKYGISGLIRPPPGFGDPAILAIKPMSKVSKPLDGSRLPGSHPFRSPDNGQAPEHSTKGPMNNNTETNRLGTPVIIHPEDVKAKDDFSDDIKNIRTSRNGRSRMTDGNNNGSSEVDRDDSRAEVLHTSPQLSGNTRGNSSLNPAAPEFTGPPLYGPRRLTRTPLTNVFPHAMGNTSSAPEANEPQRSGTSTAYRAPVAPDFDDHATDGPDDEGLAAGNPFGWQMLVNGTFPGQDPAPDPMTATLASVPTPALRPPPGFEALAQPVLVNNRYGTFPPTTVGYIGNAFHHIEPPQYRAPLAATTNLPPLPPNTAPTSGYHGINTNTNTGAGAGVPVTPLVPTLPYFPVTTKPPVPDTWSQQEFERYHEYKKATDENFRTSCKIRQARRALRQAQALALGPRAAQEARPAIAPIAPPAGIPVAPINPVPNNMPRVNPAPANIAPVAEIPNNRAPVAEGLNNVAPVNMATANLAPVRRDPINTTSRPLNAVPLAEVPGLYQQGPGESSRTGAAREARAAATALANTTNMSTVPVAHTRHTPAEATTPAATDRKGKGIAPLTPVTPAATPLPVSTSSNNNNRINDISRNASAVAYFQRHRQSQANTNGKAPTYDSSPRTTPRALIAAVRRALEDAIGVREADEEEEEEVAREEEHARARGRRMRAQLMRRVGDAARERERGEKKGKGKGKEREE